MMDVLYYGVGAAVVWAVLLLVWILFVILSRAYVATCVKYWADVLTINRKWKAMSFKERRAVVADYHVHRRVYFKEAKPGPSRKLKFGRPSVRGMFNYANTNWGRT